MRSSVRLFGTVSEFNAQWSWFYARVSFVGYGLGLIHSAVDLYYEWEDADVHECLSGHLACRFDFWRRALSHYDEKGFLSLVEEMAHCAAVRIASR